MADVAQFKFFDDGRHVEIYDIDLGDRGNRDAPIVRAIIIRVALCRDQNNLKRQHGGVTFYFLSALAANSRLIMDCA